MCLESYPCAKMLDNSPRITSLCKKPGVGGGAKHFQGHFPSCQRHDLQAISRSAVSIQVALLNAWL